CGSNHECAVEARSLRHGGDRLASTRLDGLSAIVTGAGSGLGGAEALELARSGASVVVNDQSEQAGCVVDVSEGMGGNTALVTGDVSGRPVADSLLTTATERCGGPDIVVNDACVVRDRMLFNMSDDQFDIVLRVHLRG